ncbi:MAG: hypothetical protein GXO35_07005 [Gammaproteobacteria bacterium]|nr:hypothetical protein [Gammaproteobacteria bacterium]
MNVYLGKVHHLLSERKGIHIKLCVGASALDKPALMKAALARQAEQLKKAEKMRTQQADNQPLQTTLTPNSTQKSEMLTPKIIITKQQVLKLARQRQERIKRTLIKLGTSSEQVILCQPSISKQRKQPHVEMGF